MSSKKNALFEIEQQRFRAEFMRLPLETRLRNTCPRCGCRLIGDDFERALALVNGPPKLGQCRACGWVGTK